jgi:hypothetical protein
MANRSACYALVTVAVLSPAYKPIATLPTSLAHSTAGHVLRGTLARDAWVLVRMMAWICRKPIVIIVMALE